MADSKDSQNGDYYNMPAIQELKENPVKYLKSLAMDIVVVMVSVSYIFYQILTFEKTETNPLVLIAEAIIGIICGIIIKQSLGENGFSKGYNSSIWKEEEEKYNNSCNSAIDYIDRVDNFYTVIYREKLMRYRKNHLQGVRLRYIDWFSDDGDYIGKKEDYAQLSFRQKMVLKKCIRVKIYVLNLFSEYATASEQDTHPELTDNRQRRRTLTKNTLSAIVIAIIGVYFSPLLGTWNWANLIASSLQVSLWILFGILQLYTNFNYVVQDKVNTLKEKKKYIARFNNECAKGLYKNNVQEEVTISQDNIITDKQIKDLMNGIYIDELPPKEKVLPQEPDDLTKKYDEMFVKKDPQ